MFTIGELANRTGLRTSALRYYEDQGLLQPAGRTAAGYRLYAESAEQTVRLIQRAQRLGFSLADIGVLLKDLQAGQLTETTILQTAEARYLLLEQEITAQLVLRHELGLFLQDIHRKENQADAVSANELLTQLVDQICSDPQTQAARLFEWLLRKTGCELATHEARDLFTQLRGQHIHIWQADDAYHILVVSADPQIGRVLAALTQLEANCQVHAHQQQAPELMHNHEGYLVIARGPNAFIFARLFLSFAEVQL
ncbi:MAG: MerR family transcriptional regulator [Caldilineaceae bacterium]|nr:MerR family transcriptional regulator [Caldilineaceae bacterium]